MSDKDLELIMKARPNLKPNTIKMYGFNLNKLKKLFNEDNLSFLSKFEEVQDKIKDLHYTTQRNFYNAIIVYLRAGDKNEKLIEKYDTIRNTHNETYKTDNESGKISSKQSDNFVEIEELYKMLNEMDQDIKLHKLKKKETLTAKEMTLLQVYTIYNILLKIPLRNDLAGMEAISRTKYNSLSNEDKETDNYMVVDKNKQKDISVPKELEKIIRMYLKKNGMGVLFKSSTGKPLTRNALSQLLLKTSQKYLKKNISTTIIRKIVLSDLFADTKKQQEKMAEITGHSVATMNNVYVKEK